MEPVPLTANWLYGSRCEARAAAVALHFAGFVLLFAHAAKYFECRRNPGCFARFVRITNFTGAGINRIVRTGAIAVTEQR